MFLSQLNVLRTSLGKNVFTCFQVAHHVRFPLILGPDARANFDYDETLGRYVTKGNRVLKYLKDASSFLISIISLDWTSFVAEYNLEKENLMS